ncbi:MAG: sensor histidine kinase [Bacteriovoracia bacterium]
MKKRAVTTIKSYLERSILRQSVIGFTAMALISVTATFFLSRYKMATDLQKSATAAAEAFRSRILEGDIKAVENQIHNVLGLGEGEDALILNQDRQHIYRSTSIIPNTIRPCGTVGFTCFDGYTGPGRIFFPIYFDEKKENLFGYLYLSKSVQIDWLFVVIVFFIFSFGYAAMLLGLGSVARVSSKKLASEVEEWAKRLRINPKSQSPLSLAPFLELAPLRDAIEGLTAQIERYESQASEKAKMLVLRGIAHDLLSPVSQVQLYLATLDQQMKVDPSASDTLNEIKTSLRKVSMIASQVKTLNENDQRENLLDLSDAARLEIESLQKNESIKNKNIRLNISAAAGVLAPLSRSEVARILQNLVENAADASNTGAEISVKVEKQGESSVLSVADRGCGIPAHLYDRIFEPDFTSKPATGTGLGLFIVKHICEQRNGSVHVESRQGQGTTITVSVPSEGTERSSTHAV